ncbi:MAG: ABC transporter permease [Acidobacteriota bacterium]|nr:ABC transporter permease [Acidobacteriota bacterium]
MTMSDSKKIATVSGDRITLPPRLVVRDISALYTELSEILGGKRSRRPSSPTSGPGPHPASQPTSIDFSRVEEFDTSALAFMRLFRAKHPEIAFENVSSELDSAFAAYASHASADFDSSAAKPTHLGLLEKTGLSTLRAFESARKFLSLMADVLHHTIGYLTSRRGVYPGETWNQLYFMAYRSYPIVCSMIFLVGVTISLTAAVQLKMFGADIFLADLVGIAMIRELVPMMAGIILAGKVGAAITAEIATMNVLEEVDALKTMGISPERFLMVPRILAITLAVPFLVALANIFGILGGMLVGHFQLGIPPETFYRQMMMAVFLRDVVIALVKTIVFGWTIVLASGFKGFFVGRSAGEVGRATTESVVLSITLIILIDCLFAVIFYM